MHMESHGSWIEAHLLYMTNPRRKVPAGKANNCGSDSDDTETTMKGKMISKHVSITMDPCRMIHVSNS